MERIFKIRTKSNRNPRCQYPSERRYSASMVIGLSVVSAQLFVYSVLMGTLIIHKITAHTSKTEPWNATDPTTNETDPQLMVKRVWEKVSRDLHALKYQHVSEYRVNMAVLVCSGCFLMSLGYLLNFCTGLLAWKQWYIDHNITFYFIASTFSTLTSSISLLLSTLTCVDMGFDFDSYQSRPDMSLSLLMNITILSLVGVVWSFLSTKVGYRGMKRDYPDDMVINKGGGHVEISTVMKGNKNCSAFPPDIISHFPAGDKLAKYLPKRNDGNLPKAESTLEYRQRVDKFLEGSGEPDVAHGK